MFGYSGGVGCKQCLHGYTVKAEYIVKKVEGDDSVTSLEFSLNFGGRLCSDLTGTNFIVDLYL